MLLGEVLNHINNWFVVPGGIHAGIYSIKSGVLELPFLQTGQYFRVVGSVFNDGVYCCPAALTDETFRGAVWALAIPQEVLALAAEIEEWQKKNGEAAAGPYTSESFAGYSYTKATDKNTGAAATWHNVFRSRLNPWRKLKGVRP